MNVFGVKVFAYLELVQRNVTNSFWFVFRTAGKQNETDEILS